MFPGLEKSVLGKFVQCFFSALRSLVGGIIFLRVANCGPDSTSDIISKWFNYGIEVREVRHD